MAPVKSLPPTSCRRAARRSGQPAPRSLHQAALGAALACALLATAPGASAASDGARRSAETLPAPVARVLRGHGLSGQGLSVYVLGVDDDAPVLNFNGGVPRNPASVIKLLTTMVALDVLGPAHRWQTRAYLDGPLQKGRLDGNLLLAGGGDPYLTVERLWTFARDLRARGLNDIAGQLIIDDSYFEVAPEDPAAFDGQPYRAYNVAPHALLVNFKAVRFDILADPAAGRVRVVPDPPLTNLVIDNRLTLGTGRCGGFQRGVSFRAPDGFDSGRVVFSGRFPAACDEYSLSRSVLTPNEFTWGAFKALWQQVGGTLEGGVETGSAPADDDEVDPFFTHRSASLAEIIRAVNKYSNNVMTRHLLLTLGAETREPPGTVDKGVAAIGDWMAARGIADDGLIIDNGSGLSRRSRMTAESLGAVLRAAWQSPYSAEFIASMPLSGMDGTLRNRFRDEPLAGRMHLKTGRLDHVYALAGFVQAGSGKRYAVVCLHNAEDVHRGPGKNVQDAVLRWVFNR